MTEKIKNIAVISMLGAFIAGFSLAEIFTPDKMISASERRNLAKPPQISSENILSGKFMSDFEKYSLDQFPLRDKFRSLKAVVSYYGMQKNDNNGVYLSDGFISKLDYPLNEDSLKYAVGRMRYIYSKYLENSDSNVYFSIIPDKNYFLAPKENYPSMDYEKLVGYMCSEVNFARYIDIFPTLDTDCYYKTDTHWRQEKISSTAKLLTESMGAEFQSDYEIKALDNSFYGVYYGQCGLPLEPDKIEYIQNDTLENCRVFNYEDNCEAEIYDMEKASGNDAYEMFLSGAKSLMTIENPNCENERNLIVFRDSYGSSIAPYFAGSYRKITLIDTRYLHPDLLSKFVDFSNSDVLFMYSTLVLNNSNTMK